MSAESKLRRYGKWALLPLFWVFLSFIFAGQLVFTASFEWDDALRLAMREWAPWAVLSPLVIILSNVFPITRQRWLASGLVHLLACVLVVVLCETLSQALMGSLPPRRGGTFGPPGTPPFGPNRPFRPDGAPFGPRDRIGPERPGGRGGALPLSLRTKLNGAIYWMLASLCHTAAYLRQSRAREREAIELESRLNQAKLQALRTQLQPHFLFNSLNAISSLVHTNPDAADDMIGNLSQLLRLSLDTEDQEIPLKKELEVLDLYLNIEKVRFGDRLRIEKAINPPALEAQVPSLILQPLVENAVRHGIERQIKPGTVRISARREGERLILTVTNDGPSMDDSAAASERKGIGLSNTRARLQELYGENQELAIRNRPDGGVTVDLALPWRRAGT